MPKPTTAPTEPQRVYEHARPKGFAPWAPQRKTRDLLEQINAVLAENAEHLPMTCRQIFYRLIGTVGFEKTDAAYERLCNNITRARRARLIDPDAIRDDGVTASTASGFGGVPHFFGVVRRAADTYRRDRLEGQAVTVEVWCEAGGMVPQVARVAHAYSIPVYSSGGFDSLTAKIDAARRIAERGCRTVVLHVGDHDPSGVAIFDSAAADIESLIDGVEGEGLATFERIAVTPEQIARYALEEAPAKTGDKRGDWRGGTVQCEALAPSELADEVKRAIERHLDLKLLAQVVAAEEEDRARILAALAGGGPVTRPELTPDLELAISREIGDRSQAPIVWFALDGKVKCPLCCRIVVPGPLPACDRVDALDILPRWCRTPDRSGHRAVCGAYLGAEMGLERDLRRAGRARGMNL